MVESGHNVDSSPTRHRVVIRCSVVGFRWLRIFCSNMRWFVGQSFILTWFQFKGGMKFQLSKNGYQEYVVFWVVFCTLKRYDASNLVFESSYWVTGPAIVHVFPHCKTNYISKCIIYSIMIRFLATISENDIYIIIKVHVCAFCIYKRTYGQTIATSANLTLTFFQYVVV